jgi:hypothetical protein
LAPPTGSPSKRRLRSASEPGLDSSRCRQSFGPGSLTITAVLFKEKYEETGDALLAEVATDIEAALEDLKSFAWYYRFEREPQYLTSWYSRCAS